MFGTIAWQSQTVVLSRGGLLYFSKLDGPLGYEAPVTGNSVSVEKETKPQVHVGPKWYGAAGAWIGSRQAPLTCSNWAIFFLTCVDHRVSFTPK